MKLHLQDLSLHSQKANNYKCLISRQHTERVWSIVLIEPGNDALYLKLIQISILEAASLRDTQ
jgi:hypothetical protein